MPKVKKGFDKILLCLAGLSTFALKEGGCVLPNVDQQLFKSEIEGVFKNDLKVEAMQVYFSTSCYHMFICA